MSCGPTTRHFHWSEVRMAVGRCGETTVRSLCSASTGRRAGAAAHFG